MLPELKLRFATTCFFHQALFCVEEGALPHEVDQVLEDFGMPMGPFKTSDLSGGANCLPVPFETGQQTDRVDVSVLKREKDIKIFSRFHVVGLDIGYAIRQEEARKAGIKIDLTVRFLNGQRYCGLSDMLCKHGRLGRKTGMYASSS